MWLDPIHYHARSARHDQFAICDLRDGRRWTYGAWDQEIARWTGWLHQRGLRAGERVALLAANRLEHLSLFFACARLGAIFVPLNYRLAQAELAQQLELVAPRLVLGDRPLDACEVVALDRIQLPKEGLDGTPQPLDTVLLMLFTSGSTGRPKAVMLHAAMLLWNAFHTTSGWGLRPDDVTVLHTPLFHTGGWNVSALPLLQLGGGVILLEHFCAGQVLELIARERVSVFFAVPTMFHMLAAEPGFASAQLDALRLCISGGAALPLTLWHSFRDRGVPIRQGFGLTEVGPPCFTMTELEALARPDSIGRPMPHSHALLLDEADREVEPGQVGELLIAGPHLCQGYYRDPQAFEQALLIRHGLTYFRTGDLMRRDADGFFHVVGRRKEMFISGGENVWPGEVEQHLLAHPAIRDCRLVAAPDPKWGEVGFAFYLGGDCDLEQLRAFLEPRLARYKHPRQLRRLETFPLLANGKIDRQALCRLAAEEVARET